MNRPDIRVLYKYCRINAHALTALRTGAFWFAKPASFNDPFDCSISVAHDALQESVEHALYRIIAEPGYVPDSIPPERWRADERDAAAFTAFREGLAGVMQNAGILCLAETPDDMLMWGHYADAHRGMCIGFSRSAETVLGRVAMPVVYQAKYPRLTIAHFDRTLAPNSIDQVWLVKGSEWAYEREWRVIMAEGNRAYAIDGPIQTVIFGARVNPGDRDAVVAAAREGGYTPTWTQARVSSRAFQLVLDEVTADPGAAILEST